MKVSKKVLVLGGGEAAQLWIYHTKHFRQAEIQVVGILDDSLAKETQIEEVPVIGRLSDLNEVVQSFGIEKIIIAIPSLSVRKRDKLLTHCADLNLETNILPDISSIMSTEANPVQERSVRYSDLLNREEQKMNVANLKRFFKGKTILISGAGGSIGSELVRQVNKCQPQKILLLGHGENSIFSIYKEILKVKTCPVVPIIADIQDKQRLEENFQFYRPEIIYHAAAHKHVPLMEGNPTEAIKNNVWGTMNMVEVADEFGVEKFMMISTDKTVYPTSTMGMTKKIAEWIVQSKNTKNTSTIFSVVRFGNVLGSRGSAIPLFWEQIQNNEPITITHPEMERYFMTIPEASQLVIEASEQATGNDMYILQMGEPQKIVKIVEKLIHLAGKKSVDVKIAYTGLRNGEKLSESLFEEQEMADMTKINTKFFKGHAIIPMHLTEMLKNLEMVLANQEEPDQIKAVLAQIIHEGQKEERIYFNNN